MYLCDIQLKTCTPENVAVVAVFGFKRDARQGDNPIIGTEAPLNG